MGVLGSIFNWGKKAIGHIGNAIKTVGSIVRQHHQPIALGLKALGDASGNQLLQNVGNTALATSALATMKGIGQDYGLRTNQKFPPLDSWRM